MIPSHFRPVKIRSIIFTEDCPLDCRYCNLKQGASFGTKKAFTKEEFFKLIDEIDKLDDVKLINSRILFSGGEPLLRWPWIKEIIEKYGNRFSYAFNTSGYLFTEEILEFLSRYEVNFVLSIDGNEALTNYLRPVIHNEYKIGYMKKLKKIIPTLLYYFPKTPFRIIINARYVDLLYQIYKFANELGFPYFTFLLDFSHRNYIKLDTTPKENTIQWQDKHTQILNEQLELIVKDILTSYMYNRKRTEIIPLNKILKFLFNKKTFTPENLECQLFNNRTLTTIYNNSLSSYCLGKDFQDITVLRDNVIQQYELLNNECILDKECPLFEFCCCNCCIQNGFYKSGQFFDFDELECIVYKACYKMALKFLAVGNDICKDSFLYKQYLLNLIEQKGGINNVNSQQPFL